MNNKIKIISGFPGIGKTYCYKQKSNLLISDSDSSKFSWIKKGIRHPDFPQNYIDHILEIYDRYNLILVSSHKNVREALVKNSMKFILVFPERNLKQEYIERFIGRENTEAFVDMLDKNWDSFMNEMENQKGCEIIRLKFNEYLEDYLRCHGFINI